MTERKVMGYLRKQERERARYPLFPDQIAVRSLDEEVSRRLLSRQSAECNMRTFHARVWRESRRDYWRASEEQRAAIRLMWNGWRGPLDATYFRYVVDFCTGVMAARDERMRADRMARARSVEAIGSTQEELRLVA